MKLKNLNKISYTPEIEKKLLWCKNNLSHLRQHIQVLDNGNVKAELVDVHTYIKEFPFIFVDTTYIKIQKIDDLESFKNFPRCYKNKNMYVNFSSISRTTKVNFDDLPLFTEANYIDFIFKRIDSITTKHLSKYQNLYNVTFDACDSNDLYDISKYHIKTYKFIIMPNRRLINLTELMTNRKINIDTFTLDDYNDCYTNNEIVILNNIMLNYLSPDFNEKMEKVMDFTLELIDNGLEDEV